MRWLSCLHKVIFILSEFDPLDIPRVFSWMLIIIDDVITCVLRRTYISTSNIDAILCERIMRKRIRMRAFKFWISYCSRTRFLPFLLINATLYIMLNISLSKSSNLLSTTGIIIIHIWEAHMLSLGALVNGVNHINSWGFLFCCSISTSKLL